MGAGHGGRRRHLRIPGGPRLGLRRATGGAARAGGRVPGRGGRVRSGVLRDQPAGGAGDGPAAAAAARGVLGGAGAGRARPGHAARQPDRGVRRGILVGLRGTRGRSRGLPADRRRGERYLRAGVVRAGPGGPGGDGGHRVLLLAGRAAPGVCGAAGRGVQHGAGRRGGRDGDSGHVHRIQPGRAAWPPTGGASRSPRPPTAPAGARASGCSWWSGCRTRGGTVIRSWR